MAHNSLGGLFFYSDFILQFTLTNYCKQFPQKHQQRIHQPGGLFFLHLPTQPWQIFPLLLIPLELPYFSYPLCSTFKFPIVSSTTCTLYSCIIVTAEKGFHVCVAVIESGLLYFSKVVTKMASSIRLTNKFCPINACMSNLPTNATILYNF